MRSDSSPPTDTQTFESNLLVAGVSIRIDHDQPLELTEEFAPFLHEQAQPRYRAVFRQVDSLPAIPGEAVFEDNCHRVHPDGKGGFCRSFFDAPRDLMPYSVVTYDYAAGIIDVPYLEKGRLCVSEMSNSFFHLGLEGIMIRENRLCFHASCVATDLGGILFSGPSGIGKSTQADLWCRLREGKLINGDRPILSVDGGEVLAWGSPYAGSSRCYVNGSCPVSAIVMLRQAPQCSLRRLSHGEAVRRIYAGLNVHRWDRGFINKACDLTVELAARLPVYELSCTPDEAAVVCLENALKEGKTL